MLLKLFMKLISRIRQYLRNFIERNKDNFYNQKLLETVLGSKTLLQFMKD